ncbi:MAG: RNA methyltransferase [Patescibacteria group bacterium]|nr:RNA methyltransferase [Patescibacteria group bacterium]
MDKIDKFVLVLDNIRSRYNVGSIFRTADGAGINKIYLGGITPAPPHPRIAKVALGAEKFVAFESVSTTWRALKKLKDNGYNIVALEQTDKSINYFGYKPRFPIALVLGNEVAGLSKDILKYCDEFVEIPMKGKKESLNVSVAAGILMYEASKWLK